MYCSYHYVAGSTASNILADIVAILTGETVVANLSASCDKTEGYTTITSTVAAGWTLFDASAGPNAQCLRAAVSDNASQYKYLVVDTNTANYIFFKVYEGWNDTTHAGTNLAQYSNSTSYTQRVNTTSGGRLEVYATARGAIALSFQSNVWGCSSGTTWSGVLERTRKSPWDTVANGYPPFVWACGMSTAYEPRSLNVTGTDITASYASVIIGHALGTTYNPSTTVPIDSSKTLGHVLLPINVSNLANCHFGGDISSLCDVWNTTYNYGSTFDTLINNRNYIQYKGSVMQRHEYCFLESIESEY